VVAGQTLVIITGGIDLSVDRWPGWQVLSPPKLMLERDGPGLPPAAADLGGTGWGAAIGWGQGWLIAHKDLSPFIVTFSTLSLIKGLALVYSNSAPIPNLAWPIQLDVARHTLTASVPILVMVLVLAAVAYILRNTKLGRYAFALAANETVRADVRVNVAHYKTQVYMVSSFLAGLAGHFIV